MKRIDLQFEFANNNETISLSFYDRETDDKRDRSKLDRNAKIWQMILTRIIGSETDRTIKERNRLALVELPLIDGLKA